MMVNQPVAMNARAARVSGAAFAIGGAAVVIAGVASILAGIPVSAHDLEPLASPADVVRRCGQMAPILVAAAAAVLAIVVTTLMARRRLESHGAAAELLVLGLAIDACVFGASGRIGHAADGGVMGATILCLMGGMAVLAGGAVALLALD